MINLVIGIENMENRAYALFENSIKSPATRRAYDYGLRRFVQYYKLKSIDSKIMNDSLLISMNYFDKRFNLIQDL